MSVTRYPLAWPEGWPRCRHIGGLRSGNFKVTYEKAIAELAAEIERLGGRYPILSTNLELRLDGMPKRDRSEPADRGVAVYFELKGTRKVFACDTFTTVRDNVRAIGLTIAALRSIERYGATAMLERALNAFTALPPPHDPWAILGVPRGADRKSIEEAFRILALKHHPDRGGSSTRMSEINRAREEALRGT